MANDKTVVGNTTENPADGDLKGSSPSRLVDTEGMTREQARDAIQSRAESLASTLREHGFDVGLQHSGSIAGASSYLSVYDPQTGRFIKDQIRVSGHSKGAFNSLTVHSVATDEQAQEIVDVALAMRARGPTEKMLNDQVRAREHDAKILARAQRRSTNGQLLTRSEQAALDGSNTTGRPADDVISGATAASQMLDAIERDPYADYAIRVIPGEFTGSVNVGDTLPVSNKWEDGTDTGKPLRGTSGIGIEQRSLKGVEQAIHRIGSSKTAGPNGFYFGNRVVLIKGESVASGEDVGESVIQNAEVVGVWTKPTKGKSEVQPNEQTTPQDGDVAKTSPEVTALLKRLSVLESLRACI